MRNTVPTLAITMGDPAGIGPEIIVKALADPTVRGSMCPIVFGAAAAIQQALSESRLPLQMKYVDGPQTPSDDIGIINIIDIALPGGYNVTRGAVSAAGGRIAYLALERAASLARSGDVDAIVTAPLNKEALSLAGWRGVGHTELLARFCDVPDGDVAMLLASDKLRVAHVSTHVSLRKAIELATADRIATTARLCGRAVRHLLGREPRIAVAGLNPHAGEHGLFGNEEIDEIEPAVRRLAAEGWIVTGPIPPDTVFLRAVQGEFDCVVAMYHDQGHIPSKLGGFVDTVNISLGLPIIRTSVDHGTAYDIVGKGKADERNLVHAIQMATSMAQNSALRRG